VTGWSGTAAAESRAVPVLGPGLPDPAHFNKMAEDSVWMDRWLNFIKERGLSFENFVVSGLQICMFDLYRRVCALGGLDNVIASKQMARIASDLGFRRGPDLRFYNIPTRNVLFVPFKCG
jgi:hypothetical protein